MRSLVSMITDKKNIKKYRFYRSFTFTIKKSVGDKNWPSENKKVSERIKNAIMKFLEQDGNSRYVLIKTDTVAKKKQKIPKRLLSDSLKKFAPKI